MKKAIGAKAPLVPQQNLKQKLYTPKIAQRGIRHQQQIDTNVVKIGLKTLKNET